MSLRYLGLIVILLTISGCNHDIQTSEKTIYINHYKAECSSFALSLCLQRKEAENGEWTLFYDHINDFEYEWGYSYKIKVRVENIDNPPADSPSSKYTLLEILDKDKTPTDIMFDVSVSRASGLIEKISDNIYKIYNDKEIVCSSVDCATIDSLITQDMAILFELSHPEIPTEPLLLTQIKCSSSRESFKDSCL